MKTHLPHGLRVALMAAIASVSFTSYAAADEYGLKGWKTPTVPGSTIDVRSGYDIYNIVGSGQTRDLNFTFKPDTSRFNRAQAKKVCMVESTNYTADQYYCDVYLTAQDAPFGTWLVGLSQKKTLNGNLYMRSVNSGTSITCSGTTLAVDQDSTVTGNVYLGVAGPTTYSDGVYLVKGATVKGTANLEIAGGTYNGTVAAGYRNGSNSVKFEKGTNLQITNGTFSGDIIAGCNSSGSGTTVINGGTHLQIDGGTIASRIIGGSMGAGATINDGAHLTINGGALNGYIYGGNYNGNSVINGGIDITINGGTFRGASGNVSNIGIYAAGTSGKVSGNINLTLNGDNVKFYTTGGRYYTISAGWNGSGPVDMSGVTSSTVMLENLTDASDLAKDTATSIKVMGGQRGSQLTMSNVHATINAQLSQFSSMLVRYESDLTLRQDTNATLGGVSFVQINNGSSLTLQNKEGQTWDLSNIALSTGGGGLGTLKKTGAGKLTIDASGAFYGGALSVQGGELSLSGAAAAKYLTVASGATLSVKEGNLFAGTGAGSSISINNGATLAANEGNWTLNKAATIDGVTISGKAAVGLGSEVDNAAVVTMSGNINATKGNLILKNTAIAAGKTATLSGNLTFEGAVQNSGTLSLANGTTINVDEQSLIRNGRFIDGADTSASDKNGFFADTEVCLSTGGAYSYDKAQLTLTLDGVEDSRLVLMKDSEKNQLLIGGLSLANTYFVREGNVTYSHITDVAEAISRDVKEIAVGNDGVGDTHQLTLDTALADGVTIISASDNAKVSVNDGVVLNASQTAIKGEANEVHVVGDGSVLMDDTSKLSQLAGTATMTLKDTATTFNSEAKMTGALVVANEQTLTVEDGGSIASFTSVQMGGTEAKLTSEVGSGKTDSIQSISGSGTLAKTGDGKLTVTDAKNFSGDMEVSGGTLQVEDADLMQMHKERKITVSNRAVANLTKLTTGATVKALDLDGTLGVYTGETADEGNVGSLTVTGALTVSGEGSKLEANLTLDSGSIFDVSAGYSLELGCTLTMNDNVTIVLSDTQKTALAAGSAVELMTGVDALTGTLPKNFTIQDYDGPEAQFVYSGTTLSLSQTPEPTTTTLSLLALAALAARRKRK